MAEIEKPFAGLRHAGQDKRQQSPQFFSTPLVLLLLAEEPAHGYILFKRMCELGAYDEGSDASAVYPVLRALNDEALVEAELVDEGAGPPRKVYHITPAGRITLASMSEHFNEVARAIDYFQKRYEASGPALRHTRPTGR